MPRSAWARVGLCAAVTRAWLWASVTPRVVSNGAPHGVLAQLGTIAAREHEGRPGVVEALSKD